MVIRLFSVSILYRFSRIIGELLSFCCKNQISKDVMIVFSLKNNIVQDELRLVSNVLRLQLSLSIEQIELCFQSHVDSPFFTVVLLCWTRVNIRLFLYRAHARGMRVPDYVFIQFTYLLNPYELNPWDHDPAVSAKEMEDRKEAHYALKLVSTCHLLSGVVSISNALCI